MGQAEHKHKVTKIGVTNVSDSPSVFIIPEFQLWFTLKAV